MSTTEEIETRLRQAMTVTPSEDALQWLDQRVGQAIARPVTEMPAIHRLGLPGKRMVLRPLALVAAFVVFAGTVVGAMGLIERTIQSSPSWRIAWDRAEIVGISQTDAGYTLTLERAYADVNQVMVFVSVEGLNAPASGDFGRTGIAWAANLRGPSGQIPRWSTGMGAIETDLSAIVQAWGPAEAVGGAYELTITCLEVGGLTDNVLCVEPTGMWRFRFSLPKPSGTVVPTDVSDTQRGGTVSLSELRVSPTMINGTIALTLPGTAITSWWPGTGSKLRHGDTSYDIGDGGMPVTPGPQTSGLKYPIQLEIQGGLDDASGAWTIEIPEVRYVTGVGDPETAVTVKGPWKLVLDVP